MNRKRYFVAGTVLIVVVTYAVWTVVDRLQWQREYMKRANDCAIAKDATVAATEFVLAHNDRFPDANRWEDEIRPYWHEARRHYPFTVQLSVGPGNRQRRLAMNRHLSRVDTQAVNDMSTTVLFYAVEGNGRNMSGDPPKEPVDRPERLYAYADGHVSDPRL